jgi:hypothetical protein
VADVRESIGDAICEILSGIYAGRSPQIEKYIADENISREQLASAAISSMILERYTLSPAIAGNGE